MGVLAHEILTLKHPFYPSNGAFAVLIHRIQNCLYDASLLAMAPYSSELKSIVGSSGLLAIDPSSRLTLADVMASPALRADAGPR